MLGVCVFNSERELAKEPMNSEAVKQFVMVRIPQVERPSKSGYCLLSVYSILEWNAFRMYPILNVAKLSLPSYSLLFAYYLCWWIGQLLKILKSSVVCVSNLVFFVCVLLNTSHTHFIVILQIFLFFFPVIHKLAHSQTLTTQYLLAGAVLLKAPTLALNVNTHCLRDCFGNIRNVFFISGRNENNNKSNV